jgi:hypothetical protein
MNRNKNKNKNSLYLLSIYIWLSVWLLNRGEVKNNEKIKKNNYGVFMVLK